MQVHKGRKQRLPGAGGGKRKVLFHGYRVLAGDDKNVLGIASGDGYTMLPMYLTP